MLFEAVVGEMAKMENFKKGRPPLRRPGKRENPLSKNPDQSKLRTSELTSLKLAK